MRVAKFTSIDPSTNEVCVARVAVKHVVSVTGTRTLFGVTVAAVRTKGGDLICVKVEDAESPSDAVKAVCSQLGPEWEA